jgi:hypothetical protein
MHLYGEGIRKEYANRPVYNAGVIAGTREALADLALSVYLLAKATPSRAGIHTV